MKTFTVPSTKFLQTVIGLGCMSYVMYLVSTMPEITPEHFKLLNLFLEIAGGVILGSNLFKTVQNIVPRNNGNGGDK